MPGADGNSTLIRGFFSPRESEIKKKRKRKKKTTSYQLDSENMKLSP